MLGCCPSFMFFRVKEPPNSSETVKHKPTLQRYEKLASPLLLNEQRLLVVLVKHNNTTNNGAKILGKVN
jgi:hypothetical protein